MPGGLVSKARIGGVPDAFRLNLDDLVTFLIFFLDSVVRVDHLLGIVFSIEYGCAGRRHCTLGETQKKNCHRGDSRNNCHEIVNFNPYDTNAQR